MEDRGLNGGMRKKDDRDVKRVKGTAWDSERTMARITMIRHLIQTANCVIPRTLCGREVARGSVLMRSRVHYKPDFDSHKYLVFEEPAKLQMTILPLRFCYADHPAITFYVSQSVKL